MKVTLFQLIAEGDPVPLDRLAAAAGLPLEQVQATTGWRHDHPDCTVLPVAEYDRQIRAIQPKLP